MRIVVDAMGSDRHPQPDVEGAVQAAREYGVEIVLVGNKDLVEAELARHHASGLAIRLAKTIGATTKAFFTQCVGRIASISAKSAPPAPLGLGLGPAPVGPGPAPSAPLGPEP